MVSIQKLELRIGVVSIDNIIYNRESEDFFINLLQLNISDHYGQMLHLKK